MQDSTRSSTIFRTGILIAAMVILGYQRDSNASTCPGGALTAPPTVTITSETLIPASTGIPEYCDVKGFVTTNSSSGNEDQFELALPDPPTAGSGWNGKFLFLGNGGFAGSIQAAVTSGLITLTGEYATGATDAGHESPLNLDGLGALDGSFALNNLQAQQDFLYNGVHVTALATQTLTQQYYGSAPKHLYFDGCSDGGHEAAVESQVYPNDFDGIIEGDPAIEIGNVGLGFAWNEQHVVRTVDSPIPASKINELVDPAITAECDALDGVKDGLIQDPRLCNFDVASLRCPATKPASQADTDSTCLSTGQVATLDAIFAGAQSSLGLQLYPGYTVSNPADGTPPSGMPLWITGEITPTLGTSEPWGPIPAPPTFTSPITGFLDGPLQWSFVDQSFKYFYFSDPTYNSLTFSLNSLRRREHSPEARQHEQRQRIQSEFEAVSPERREVANVSRLERPGDLASSVDSIL
jgi:hypothetical protein